MDVIGIEAERFEDKVLNDSDFFAIAHLCMDNQTAELMTVLQMLPTDQTLTLIIDEANIAFSIDDKAPWPEIRTAKHALNLFTAMIGKGEGKLYQHV